MRFKLGRPDLASYAGRFDVPSAGPEFAVIFLGVSSLLFDDGTSALLTDGYFSRPSLFKVGLSRISPDDARISSVLDRAGLGGESQRLAAVIPVHTHFDHVMDSAVVAQRTGARLLGGESAANVGRGQGLPTEQIQVAMPGQPITCGVYTVTMIVSEHCPPDRFPGVIAEPVAPPVKAAAYKCGEAWSLLVEHPSGRTALVQGSAGFVPGSLSGHHADVAYLGVGQLGIQSEHYIRTYWAETVEAVGARRVVLTHWDDFFRPLDRPLRALPFAGDDLDVTMRVLTELAARQGVALHLPSVWKRENPWQGLG